MKFIVWLIYFIFLSFIALFIYQNFTILTSNLQITYFINKSATLPLYYAAVIPLGFAVLLYLYLKVKFRFILRSKNKTIEKLEKELNNLRNLELTDKNNPTQVDSKQESRNKK